MFTIKVFLNQTMEIYFFHENIFFVEETGLVLLLYFPLVFFLNMDMSDFWEQVCVWVCVCVWGGVTFHAVSRSVMSHDQCAAHPPLTNIEHVMTNFW